MDIRNVNPAVVSIAPLNSNDGTKTAVEPSAAKPVLPVVAPTPAKEVDEAREAPDRRELLDSVNKVNEAVKIFNSSVRFSIDEETQQRVVKVVDMDTNEVIRQMPSEEVLAIAKVFDKLQGLLIKDKA